MQGECEVSTSKKCRLTNGTCEYQGAKVFIPTTEEEATGKLIIDALEGRL